MLQTFSGQLTQFYCVLTVLKRRQLSIKATDVALQ